MFRFSANVFVLLAITNPMVTQYSQAFVLRHQLQQGYTRYPQQSTVQRLHASSPQPPGTPPPEAYFADNNKSEEDVEQPKTESSPPPPEPEYDPEPMFSDEDLEKMQQFSNDLGSKAVDYIIKPMVDIQKGVPAERIKGAALTGAFLGLLASKGIVVSSAASLSAAYLAISRGVAGDVFRTVGGIAWDVTDSAVRLLSIVANNDKLSMLPKGLAQKTMEAIQNTKESARYLQMADLDDLESAEQAFLDSQDDLERVLQEAEAVIGEADEAIANAQALEEKLIEEDVDVSIPYDAAAQLAYAETDQSMAFEDFKAQYYADAVELVKSKRSIDVTVPYSAAARLAYDQTDKSMPFADFQSQFVADAVDLVKSKQAERNREREEAARIKAEEEEAAKQEEQDMIEDEYEMDEEDFLAAVELAQESLEGKIVGVDEAIADTTAKEQWDAAGSLARELRPDDQEAEFDDEEELNDEEDDVDDDFLLMDDEFEELDMEALGKAAREAVEMFDEEKVSPGQAAHAFEEGSAAYSSMTVPQLKVELEGRGLPIGGKKADLIERLSTDDAVGDEDDEDYFTDDDDDDDEDFVMDKFEGLDMEALGKAAREAVQVSFEDDEDDEAEDDFIYYSSKTVAELKEELQERGLPMSGKKADLVDRLVEAASNVEVDDEDEVEYDDDISGFDLEQLGRQAREAVQMFQSGAGDFDEEPTEEMLAELENEMTINGAFSEESSTDFTGMTVAQLKDECRNRGLKVSGKKAELIERLQEAV